MKGSSGNVIANQFIIRTPGGDYFQSYDSIIAFKPAKFEAPIQLDQKYWDYSTTTGRYRNQFLNEGKSETQRKINDGTYKLVDLNA